MSFGQIALAAECITLARVDFAQKVLVAPALQLVGGIVGGKVSSTKPQMAAERPRPSKQETAAETQTREARARARDAHLAATAARFNIPISGPNPPE